MSTIEKPQTAKKPALPRPVPSFGTGFHKKNGNVKRAAGPDIVLLAETNTAPDIEPESEMPPPFIAGDPKKRRYWESASDDARFLGKALCELGNRIQATGIESYFEFADAWYARYPKSQKKQYERGMKAVQEGAAMSPYSVNQVYSILNTTKTYTREHYDALAAQAQSNGVTIRWTHLRLVAERLGKGEFDRVREEVERQMVSRQMTELTLKQLIDTLAPETAATRTQTLKKQVSSVIADYGKSVKRFGGWGEIIERLESEFTGESPEEIEATRNQVGMLLQFFDETTAFLEKNRRTLETLQEVVVSMDNSRDKPPTETNRTIAQNVARSVAEHRNPVETQTSRHLVLTKGFNRNDPPPMVSLDEFEETDEGDAWDEQWDDELDDEGDPVFAESGDLPDAFGLNTRYVSQNTARDRP